MSPLPAVKIDGYRGAFLRRPTAGWPDDLVGASGPFRLTPAAVAIPTSSSDVQALVRWAAAEGQHLTARAAATGMPGGNIGRHVLVDLRTHFRSVLSVNPDRREITLEAGVTLDEVEAAASAYGLTFPVQPSSSDRCTVGGLVANNAAGARSLKHGAARQWIRRVELVAADGAPVRLDAREHGRGDSDPFEEAARQVDAPDLCVGWPAVRKNSSGYALDCMRTGRAGLDLFVGSEGTLGLATEITLALAANPPSRATLLVAARDMGEISDWASVAREANAVACEFIGRRLIEMAMLDKDLTLSTLARGAEALVLIELEGDVSVVDAGMRSLEGTAIARGSRFRTAASPKEADSLWGLRRRASPAIAAAAESGLRSAQFIEDSVVPPERFGEYLRGVQLILARAGTDAAVFGHAGDAHAHVNPLIDLRRPDWLERVRMILEETVDLVAKLGGTLSGEHGDGRVRAPFLRRIWGARRTDAFNTLKELLDPEGVLNPGVKIPLPGQDPLEGLEYLERSAS